MAIADMPMDYRPRYASGAKGVNRRQGQLKRTSKGLKGGSRGLKGAGKQRQKGLKGGGKQKSRPAIRDLEDTGSTTCTTHIKVTFAAGQTRSTRILEQEGPSRAK